jgi:hypothetical protein
MAKRKNNLLNNATNYLAKLALNPVGTVNQTVKKAKKRKARTQVAGGLDRAGADYKRLIMDPCNAALVAPAMPGGTGNIIRLRKTYTRDDLIVGMSGTPDAATYFAFHYIPSFGNVSYKAVSTGGTGLNTAAGATASTGKNSGNVGGYIDPDNFIKTNASSFRVLAACVEFNLYTSSNAVRGEISSVVGDGPRKAMLINQAAISINTVVAELERIRTPYHCQWIFRPESGQWVSESNGNWPTTDNSDVDQRNDIISIYLSNMTSDANGCDFTFTVTQVVEFIPLSGQGIATGQVRSKTRNTLDQILNAIPDKVFDGATKVLDSVQPYF